MTTRVQEGSDIERNEDQHMANDEEPRGRMVSRDKQNRHANIGVNCVPMRKYKEREKAEERQKTHETMYLQPDGKGKSTEEERDKSEEREEEQSLSKHTILANQTARGYL